MEMKKTESVELIKTIYILLSGVHSLGAHISVLDYKTGHKIKLNSLNF